MKRFAVYKAVRVGKKISQFRMGDIDAEHGQEAVVKAAQIWPSHMDYSMVQFGFSAKEIDPPSLLDEILK